MISLPIVQLLFVLLLLHTICCARFVVGKEKYSISNSAINDNITIIVSAVFCSENDPCPASSFCNFNNGNYNNSTCIKCEDLKNDCYQSNFTYQNAKSCASTCGSQLIFPKCKFCPQHHNGNTEICQFCKPRELLDQNTTNREITLFGHETTCSFVNEYFQMYSLDFNEDECKLAIMYNYLCNCEGESYGGADSDLKRALLTWLPRVTAILSFMGSLFIIVDISRSKQKRQKIFGQLMVTLSIFDLLGSAAYALTTLPLPKEDGIYGSHGNDATCTAQGFFIQMSTVSAYINVSLAIYYYQIIKLSHSEHKLQRTIKKWLFFVPIVIGLSFAFLGIPYYDNMMLWCNNSARYWPDIPIILASVTVTILMFRVWYHVYRKEKASKKWRRPGVKGHKSMSNKVFWQGFWYLMAFYIVWPPYLCLQYLWASGKAYSMYGFLLWAGIVTPSQGACNFYIYIRPRNKFSLRKLCFSWCTKMRLSCPKWYGVADRRTDKDSAQTAATTTNEINDA